MGVNYFTDEQVEMLRKNPYVKNVSSKAITYEKAFKEYFYQQHIKGIGAVQIFKEAGFDPKVLGRKRIKSFNSRNKVDSTRYEGFIDRRKGSSGRPSTKELSSDEIINRLKYKNKLLQQENDFLKRVRFINKKQFLKPSKIKHQEKNID